MEASFLSFLFFFLWPHPEPWNLHPLQWKHRVLTTGSPGSPEMEASFFLNVLLLLFVCFGSSQVTLVIRNLLVNAGDMWLLIPGLGRSPGGGYSNPLQYSLPEESHGQRGLVGVQSIGSQRVRHNSMHTSPGVHYSMWDLVP